MMDEAHGQVWPSSQSVFLDPVRGGIEAGVTDGVAIARLGKLDSQVILRMLAGVPAPGVSRAVHGEPTGTNRAIPSESGGPICHESTCSIELLLLAPVPPTPSRVQNYASRRHGEMPRGIAGHIKQDRRRLAAYAFGWGVNTIRFDSA